MASYPGQSLGVETITCQREQGGSDKSASPPPALRSVQGKDIVDLLARIRKLPDDEATFSDETPSFKNDQARRLRRSVCSIEQPVDFPRSSHHEGTVAAFG